MLLEAKGGSSSCVLRLRLSERLFLTLQVGKELFTISSPFKTELAAFTALGLVLSHILRRKS
jgi:hypothetical protein